MKDREIKMSYEQACSEMNFILNNLELEDLEKIPNNFIQFFADNMDETYQVNINLDKPLYEQDLLDETKAFIKIIDINYFTPAEKRDEKIAKLGLDDDIDNTYNYDKLFTIKNKDSIETEIGNIEKDETTSNIALIEYKEENKIINFIKKLINKFLGK